MPLHPDARRWLDRLPPAPDTELDPVRMRADAANQWVRSAPVEAVSVVENRTIPARTVRSRSACSCRTVSDRSRCWCGCTAAAG